MRIAALVSAATMALVAAPAAQAQAEPPAKQGCDAVLVSVGAVDVTLLGQLNVHTPGTTLQVRLGGIAAAIVCPILGGGAPTP